MGQQSSRSIARAKSPRNLDAQADSDLVELVRKGNTHAFGVLWTRHAEPGKAVARGYSASHDPDDLVAEAFTKIFQSIQSGKGPTTAFRAYLFTTIRNVSASWGRSSKESSSDELDDLVDPKTLEDETLAALDRSLTASAFRSLPTRWQEALWYSEVESMTVQQIAPLLGMKANAVSALTFRAREGLRQAWIQAHISSVPEHSDCRWSIDRLGSHTRGALGSREQSRLDLHLAGCGRCSIIASEAQEVGSRLALILLPLAAGIGGAASYLTWSQTDQASSLVAAAAPVPMPASVATSFGSTAAVSTAALSTGTTIALVAVAALGLIGGGTAVAPLFFNPTSQNSAAQPTTDTDAPVLADPPVVDIPSAVLPPTIVDVFAPRPSSRPSLPPSPSPTVIPGETPGPTPTATAVPTSLPTTHPTPTSTPDPTPTPTAPPTEPPIPVAPDAPAVGSPASGSVFNSSTVQFSGTAPRSSSGNAVEVSGGVSLARTMFEDTGFAGAGFTGTAFAGTAFASPTFAGTVFAANVFTGTVGDDGSWTVDVGPLADGTHTLDIRQRTSAGTTSKPTSVVVTVDTDVRTPELSLVSDPNNRLLPSAAGTAEPGATVELVNASGTTLDRVKADAAGDWSIAAVPGLGFGEQTIAARQTDPAGNVSGLTGAQALILKPVAILSPTAGATVDRPATGEFAGDAGAEVQVTIDGQQTEHTIADRFPLSLGLPTELGTHTLSVRYMEVNNGATRFGPALSRAFTVGLAAPNVSSPTPGTSFSNDTIHISGDVPPIDAGNTIEVSAGAAQKFTGIVAADGSWSVDAGPFVDGVHALSIRQRTATNTSKPTGLTVTTDTIALPPTIALAGHAGGRLNPSAAGTAEPGATVVLVNELDAEIASTTADASGGWSIDVVGNLGFGPHSIAAQQTDTLGNGSASSGRVPLTLDPVALGSLVDGADLDATDAVELVGVPRAGVQVSIDGHPTQHYFDAQGDLSLNLANGLPFGRHALTARYAEVVNGTTRLGPPLDLQFIAIPTAPVVSSPVSGASSGGKTVLVRGTTVSTAAGDTIEVSGSAGEFATGVVAGDGSWAVNATLITDGVHTLSVHHRTPTGVSKPTAVVVTIDTIALPPTFALSGDAGGRLNPSAAGTAEPGATVVLVDELDAEIASTTADASGDWSIDVVGTLGIGAHTIAAQQTDALGNDSALTARTPFALAGIDIRSPGNGGTATRPVTLDLQGIPGAGFRLELDGQLTATWYTFDLSGAAAPALAGDLSFGLHDVAVRYADDVNGTTRFGPAVGIRITVAPAAPTVTSPAPGTVIDVDTVSFRGTLPPTDAGHTVEVSNGAGQTVSTTVGFDGSWSVDVGPLADAVYTFSIIQRSSTGETSAPIALVVTINTVPSPPGFTLVPDPNGRLFPSASGTAKPGASVELVNGAGTTVAQATALLDGTWSIDVVEGLDFGANTLAARQTTPLGVSDLTSPESLTLAPLALTTMVDGQVVSGGHPVTFQGVQDANFQFGVDGDFDGSRFEMFPLYDLGGTFTFPLTDPMTFGEHTMGWRYVELENGIPRYGPAAHISFTLAYRLEAIGVRSPAAGGTVGSGTIRFSGDVAPVFEGETVEVSDSAGGVYRGTVGADWKWSVDAGPYPDGNHTFGILLRSTTTGVVRIVPSLLVVTVDTRAMPPAFTLAGNQGGRFVPSASGIAEPGATVELFNGGVKIDQATADAAGNWSVAALSGLGLGTHAITARQTDPVGNVSALTGPTSVTLAPVQVASFVGGKSPQGAPVDFSGVAGAPFEATLDGVATPLTLGAGGTLSQNLLAGAALGSHTLSVRYSQVVSGVTVYSPASTTTFEVVPVTPVVTSPTFGATVDGNPFVITGTVPATDVGNRVEVDSFGRISVGTVGPGGSWTVGDVIVPIDPSGQGHRYTLFVSQCTPAGVCSIPRPFDVVVAGW